MSKKQIARAFERMLTLAWVACGVGAFEFQGTMTRAAATYEVLHEFSDPPSSPIGELAQGADGNFYGTTSAGGVAGSGTIFKMTASGVLTTLLEFTGDAGANKGAAPGAGLILASDGNFYGTTARGGASGLGTVFKMTPAGALTTLVEFTGDGVSNRGSLPYATLLEGSDGAFYGTTARGGAKGLGTIFKVTSAGTLTTLVEFTGAGANNRGAYPYGALIEAGGGFLYGTTSKGGANGNGTIFRVTKAGALDTLVEFTDNVSIKGLKTKGASPYGALVKGSDGAFYGTTSQGGAKEYGTVFKMTADFTLVTLVELTGNSAPKRGTLPESALVVGADGNFYGTTYGGGAKGFGTVFKVTPGGVLTTVANFSGTDGTTRGRVPQAGLVRAHDGSLFGTTFAGGADDRGTVFRIGTDDTFTSLAEFKTVNLSTYYHAGLLEGPDGAFYGTTANDGIAGKGTIFKIFGDGSVKTLVEFTGDGAVNKGALPYSQITAGNDGNFYGTTVMGGAGDFGTIYKVTPAGVLTTLVQFTGTGGANRGSGPGSGLILGSDGNFYGTTTKGGAGDFGTVFKMTPAGVLTTLIEFTGAGASNRGSSPYTPLVEGSDGNFYGTTISGGAHDDGTVFKMTPAGVLTTLAEFADAAPSKGAYPQGALVEGDNTTFYGTTATGGATGDGTIFSITPAGVLTTLVEFTGKKAPNKGTYPKAAMVKGSDGNFYGTTGFGGTNGTGTVYRVSPEGAFATLAEFPASAVVNAGVYPQAGLAFGSDGNLYGAASAGGSAQAGAAFRLRIRATPATNDASSVFADTVMLNARVKPGTLQAGVTFEYGTSTAYGSSTPLQTISGGSTAALISAALNGLMPHTTYHFRVVMTDSTGTIYGEDQTFTTEPMAVGVIASGDSPSGEPPTTLANNFGIPSIADSGAVAVLANLTTATGKDAAILNGSPPVVVARKLDLAPKADGSTVATRKFSSFGDPVCNNAGELAFSAKILDGTAPKSGLWTNAGGTLREVVTVGSSATGVSGAIFRSINSFAMSGTGQVFYVATVAGGGAKPASDMGVWVSDSNGSHLLLREGDPLDGSTVTAFNVLGAVPGSAGQGRGYRDAVVSALVSFADKRQAIMHFSVGTMPEVVAKTGDPVANLAGGDKLNTFGVPTISAGDTAAFLATMLNGSGDVTAANNQVILADSNAANLPVVVRKGAAAPGIGGATFAALANPVYNADHVTAFVSTVAGGGVKPANNAGIWWASPGGLALLARVGDEPVGVPGGTWAAFTSLGLPDGAGPAFVAKIAPGTGGKTPPMGVNATNNLGLWAVDSTGELRLIVRTGDTMHVGGNVKTLSLMTILSPVLGSPGQARSYNHAQDLVFRATFTDRTQAIMRVHLP